MESDSESDADPGLTFASFRKKIPQKRATRHLKVIGVGMGTGLDRDVVLAEVQPVVSGIENVYTCDNDVAIIVSFVDVKHAQEAHRVLHCREWPSLNRKTHVRYTNLVDTSQDSPIPCTTTTDHVHVPGLVLVKDFLSQEQEGDVLAAVDAAPWITQLRRRVQHYGYVFRYAERRVDPNQRMGPLPAWASSLIPAIRKHLPESMDASSWEPDQLTVNEYVAGQGIGRHIDTHSAFGDPIVSVSLAAEWVMEFRNAYRASCTKLMALPRGCLLIMSGESRYAWQHYIARRRLDHIDGVVAPRERRVSLTFRTVKAAHDPCCCAWAAVCDSQGGSIAPTDLIAQGTDDAAQRAAAAVAAVASDPSLTSPLCAAPIDVLLQRQGEDASPVAPTDLERAHVHQFYEHIAEHFSDTRHTPWPKVLDFLNAQPAGSVMCDVGCGNGRYMRLNEMQSSFCLGCDRVAKFASICRDHSLQVQRSDCLALPYRGECMDVVICVAVLHHLSTHAHRAHAIQELLRITRPGGALLVTVWAFEQEATSRRRFEQQDTYVSWSLPPRYHTPELAQHGAADAPVEANRQQGGALVMQRYCHVFREGELETLVQEAARDLRIAVAVEKSYYDKSNWCVIVRRGTADP